MYYVQIITNTLSINEERRDILITHFQIYERHFLNAYPFSRDWHVFTKHTLKYLRKEKFIHTPVSNFIKTFKWITSK